MRRTMTILLGIVVTLWNAGGIGRAEDSAKPNIPAIQGDAICWFNFNAYNRAIIAHETPNTDGIANRGMLVADG